MNIDEKYRLRCGHLGRVVAVYEDAFAVKGHGKNRCDVCGKRSKDDSTVWNPTVHIIAKEGGE